MMYLGTKIKITAATKTHLEPVCEEATISVFKRASCVSVSGFVPTVDPRSVREVFQVSACVRPNAVSGGDIRSAHRLFGASFTFLGALGIEVQLPQSEDQGHGILQLKKAWASERFITTAVANEHPRRRYHCKSFTLYSDAILYIFFMARQNSSLCNTQTRDSVVEHLAVASHFSLQNRTAHSVITAPRCPSLHRHARAFSNCGNPSLRLFGFGPVVRDGFGIGYIIKGLQMKRTERTTAALCCLLVALVAVVVFVLAAIVAWV